MDSYRTAQLIKSDSLPKNVYRYITRDSQMCPICECKISEFKSYYEHNEDNPNWKRCQPFKRIRVKGFLWWKKLCPLSGIHAHLYCRECRATWIYPISDIELPFKETILT